MLIVFLVAGFTNAALADAAPGSDSELSRKILQDERMDEVLLMGYELLKSGMNAGSKYDQVWIRDLNTFIVPLLEAAPQQPVREALLPICNATARSVDEEDHVALADIQDVHAPGSRRHE